VTPRQPPGTPDRVIQQVRAAAALLAFTNALAISVFSLVPGTHVGYPAVSLGLIGIAFTAAAIRSVWESGATRSLQLRQVGLAVLLLLILGTELASGITLLAGSGGGTSLEMIGYALATSLLVGIARAWELVGEWNTNLMASLAMLARGTHVLHDTASPRDQEEPLAQAHDAAGGDTGPAAGA